MSGISRLGRARRARSITREVKGQMADLDDQFALTLTFAAAMIDSGDLRAAAGAIEEQRHALAHSAERMERTLSTGSRLRKAGVLAGIAAAVISSSVFVAVVRQGEAAGPAERLARAADRLESAVNGGADAATLQGILDGMDRAISALPPDDLARGPLREPLMQVRGHVLKLLPRLPIGIAVQAKQVAFDIERAAESTARAPSEPPSDARTPSAPAEPGAPAGPSAPAEPGH